MLPWFRLPLNQRLFPVMLPSVMPAAGSLNHSRPPLILVAASARSLAESAAAAGFTVLAVDCFQDQDLVEFLVAAGGRYLGRLTTFSDLPRILEHIPVSIPLLWAGGLENQRGILRQISHKRPLAGLPLTAVEILRSPLALAAALGTDGPVSCPECLFDQFPTDGRWLWKSSESSGGLGVQRLTPEFQIQLNADTRRPRGYFQQELDGLPVSAIACCDGHGTSVVGMTLQWSGWPELGAENFRFCGNLGPLTVPPRLIAAVQSAAAALFNRAGNPRGVLGLDMLLTPDRCWLLEVNPRIPASAWIYEAAAAPNAWNAVRWLVPADSMESHKDACFEVSSRAPLPLRSQLILWSRQKLIAPDLPELSASLPAGARLADRPASGSPIPPHSPVCSVLCEGENVPQMIAAVDQLPAGLMSAVDLNARQIAGRIAHHWQTWLELAHAWG